MDQLRPRASDLAVVRTALGWLSLEMILIALGGVRGLEDVVALEGDREVGVGGDVEEVELK